MVSIAFQRPTHPTQGNSSFKQLYEIGHSIVFKVPELQFYNNKKEGNQKVKNYLIICNLF